MKQVRLKLSGNALKDEKVLIREIINHLNQFANDRQRFNVSEDEKHIVEYDENEELDIIHWYLEGEPKENYMGTFDINLDS